MSHCGVEVIFVTSERLYDHQRALIKKVFNAPVANGYGEETPGLLRMSARRKFAHYRRGHYRRDNR